MELGICTLHLQLINTSLLEFNISTKNPDFRLNYLLSALQNVSMPHNWS